jgi:ABC-type Co2+ transport system permease subunit
MKRMQRAKAVSMAAGLIAIVGVFASVAASAAQAPLIFPLKSGAKGPHPGKTVTTAVQRPVAPIGGLRVVQPLGGTRPPAKTILAKRPG